MINHHFLAAPLLPAPPPELAAAAWAAFLAAFSCNAFPSLYHFITQQQPNRSNHYTTKQIRGTEVKIRLYLSRRCSGVRPSSAFLPFPPARAAALSRSRSLWLPRDDYASKFKSLNQRKQQTVSQIQNPYKQDLVIIQTETENQQSNLLQKTNPKIENFNP